MLELCRFSYETRRSPSMKELVKRSSKRDTVEDSNAGRLTKIRHYIGRLSCHLKSARGLVVAAKRFPALFPDDIPTEFCPSQARATKPPPMGEDATLNGIANRMLPKTANVSTASRRR